MRCELVRCILACEEFYKDNQQRSQEQYDDFVFMLVDSGRYQKFSLQELVDEYETELFHAALVHYYYAKSIVDYHAKTGRALESLDEKKEGAWSAAISLEKGRFAGKVAADVLKEIQAILDEFPDLFLSHQIGKFPFFDLGRLSTLSKPEKPSRINPENYSLSGEVEEIEDMPKAVQILRLGYSTMYVRNWLHYSDLDVDSRYKMQLNPADEGQKKLDSEFSKASLHEIRCFALYAKFRVQVERYVWFSASNAQRASWSALSPSQRREDIRLRGEKLLTGKFKGQPIQWLQNQAQKVNDKVLEEASRASARKKKSRSDETTSKKKASLFSRLSFMKASSQKTSTSPKPEKAPRSLNVDRQRARRAIEIYEALYLEDASEFVDPNFLGVR